MTRAQSILVSLISTVVFTAGIATAQTSNGYAIAGPGSYDGITISQEAIGGEWVIGKGIGAAGELGFEAGKHASFGMVSFNLYYHFVHRGAAEKLDPFVTGGYTLAIAFGSANVANFGLGTNYWFSRHFGVRGEFHDVVGEGSVADANAWAIRAGIAFR